MSTSFWASSWARSRRASRHRDAAPLGAGRQDVGEHVLEVDAHLLHALAGEDLEHRHGLRLGLELDHPLVELAGAQLGPQLLAGGLARGVGGDLLERAAR